jgi:hypothetical protein
MFPENRAVSGAREFNSMRRQIISLAFIGACVLQLTACGTYAPPIAEYYDHGTDELTASGDLELKIRQQIYCDIVDGVIKARNEGYLPKGWAVQVTLDLQVDETGAVSPGATFINPLRGTDTFSVGLGANLSSQGTREDKFGAYWNLDKFTDLKQTPCEGDRQQGSSLLLESDLGIQKWLFDALYADFWTPSSQLTKNADGAFKQEYLSYHVRFIVISGGSATPTWKLVRFTSGNGNLPLLSANRTRTHDVLMTFGPAFKPGSPNLATTSHTIQEFGIAASNGNRTILAPLISP